MRSLNSNEKIYEENINEQTAVIEILAQSSFNSMLPHRELAPILTCGSRRQGRQWTGPIAIIRRRKRFDAILILQILHILPTPVFLVPVNRKGGRKEGENGDDVHFFQNTSAGFWLSAESQQHSRIANFKPVSKHPPILMGRHSYLWLFIVFPIVSSLASLCPTGVNTACADTSTCCPIFMSQTGWGCCHLPGASCCPQVELLSEILVSHNFHISLRPS